MATNDRPGEQRIAGGMAELVAASRTAVGGAENARGAVEVIAVFDHDFQAHVLVQEWDHTSADPRWTYRLWFLDGELVVPVRRFDDAVWPEPPLVEAAQLAGEWRRLCAGVDRFGA